MKKLCRWGLTVVAMLSLTASVLLLSASAAAAQTSASAASSGSAPAFTFHLKVPAAAEFFGTSCPNEWPAIDTRCEDIGVLYYRESEPSTLRNAQWSVFVHHQAVVLHPDRTVTGLFDIGGILENPQGTFDEKTFTFASVHGSVPMSDGSTADIDLTWDMAAAQLNHGGNDSLFNVINGINRHYADRCLTVNSLAHQQWRAGAPGQITGSIMGTNVEEWDRPEFEPLIAGRSVFTFVYVEHGGC